MSFADWMGVAYGNALAMRPYLCDGRYRRVTDLGTPRSAGKQWK